MSPDITAFFASLWQAYVGIAPGAGRLHAAFTARGEAVVNDHIAFRTYDVAPINLAALEKHLLGLGWQRHQPYTFTDKKLRAWGYVHPQPGVPRIFLSELDTAAFSPALQHTVRTLVQQVDAGRVARRDVLWAGRLWQPVSIATYRSLLAESEYAAWVAALGLLPNHFTISVRDLRTLNGLGAVCDFVESQGFALNTSGGRIKGTRAELLEQASTMADQIEVAFSDGTLRIPTCYYEFAQRHTDTSGRVYDGFVAASADKIFESTNVRKS